jgi:hypothetical protein
LKLDAFLGRYGAALAPDAGSALSSFWHAWNGNGEIGPAWVRFIEARAALAVHAKTWAAALAARPDLAEALVKFCRDRV